MKMTQSSGALGHGRGGTGEATPQLAEGAGRADGLRARGYLRESTVEQGANSGPIVQRADMVKFAKRTA